MLRSDRLAMIARSSFPSGVANLLTHFGSNKHAEELLAAPPRRTGQTGASHQSDRCCREDPARDQRTSSGRIPSGRRTQGCPRLGRPARTSSDIAETKEEQPGRGWKSKGMRKER
jgi:hypothetical protein